MIVAPAKKRRSWLWRALLRSRRGSAAVEFAVVAPVFIVLLMGVLDLGHWVYAKAVLNGAVQKAARESSLETADTSAADALVEDVIGPVVPDATFASARQSYFDFNDIGRPESWNDDRSPSVVEPEDGDGICNNNEIYTDENRNGEWDDDIGVEGNGGASDVVYYTVTVNYTPVFRIPFMPDTWAQRSISATAVRKNQPFATQEDYGSTARNCPDV